MTEVTVVQTVDESR